MNIFSKALNKIGALFIPKRERPTYAPPRRVPHMTAEQKRADREFARIKVWARRYNSMRVGGGTKINASGTNLCSPRNITVLSRGAKAYWSNYPEWIHGGRIQ